MEKMTRTRREELIEKYVETVVEHMDLGELMLYAQDDELQDLYKFTKEENAIVDEINEQRVDKLFDAIRENGGTPL